MSDDVQIKGPKIQRDIALLLRLLMKIDGWDDPSKPMLMTTMFVEQIGGYEPCPCSSCASLVSSSKTTANILWPHIQDIVTLDRHHPDVVFTKVYHLLETYLMCLNADDPDVIATIS